MFTVCGIMHRRCCLVHHKYNNVNSQLDATITNFIDNYNQLNMFRSIISPIIRSTRLCLQLVVQNTGDAACHQQAASSVLYTTSCKQSSAPGDGRNYRPKHVELIQIINKLLLLHLVGCLYYCINDARSHKHQNYLFVCRIR